MPYQKHHTTTEEDLQEIGKEDDWTKEVVPRLPGETEEQAKKLKAFERSREIGSATDLLRGLLAYVFVARSFQQLGRWSVLTDVADVSANDWRKRLRKASDWLDWLLQEVLAMAEPLSPRLIRGDASCWSMEPIGSVLARKELSCGSIQPLICSLVGLRKGIRDGSP